MNRIKTASKLSLIIAALTLTLVLVGAARGTGPQSTLRYLAVGVSKYPELTMGEQLRFAHKDALDLARTWQNQQGKLCQQVDGVTLIDEQANRRNVLAALDDLIHKSRPGDLALISLCGHGGGCGFRGEWGFLPSDYNGTDVNTALTATTLRAKLTQLARRGVTVVLILDCCHAGAFSAQDLDFVVFAACLPQEFSREQPDNGLFTRAILEALQGRADFNGDGLISLAEVDAYVARRVEQLMNGQAQNPTCNRPTNVRGNLPIARVTVNNGL